MLKDVSPRVQYEVLQSGAIPVVLSINDALDGMYTSHLPILMVQTLDGFNKHLLGAPAFQLPFSQHLILATERENSMASKFR